MKWSVSGPDVSIVTDMFPVGTERRAVPVEDDPVNATSRQAVPTTVVASGCCCRWRSRNRIGRRSHRRSGWSGSPPHPPDQSDERSGRIERMGGMTAHSTPGRYRCRGPPDKPGSAIIRPRPMLDVSLVVRCCCVHGGRWRACRSFGSRSLASTDPHTLHGDNGSQPRVRRLAGRFLWPPAGVAFERHERRWAHPER